MAKKNKGKSDDKSRPEYDFSNTNQSTEKPISDSKRRIKYDFNPNKKETDDGKILEQKSNYNFSDEKIEIKSSDYNNPQLLLDKVEIYLSEYIVGQEKARTLVSQLLVNHALSSYGSFINLDKALLLIGPTGTGKSYIPQTASKLLGFPFVDFDLTSVTTAGYQGANIDDSLELLIKESAKFFSKEEIKEGKDLEYASWGIINLDEFDKISANKNFQGKDVSAEVQLQLLRFLEGGTYILKDGRTFNTSNLLFFMTGAFDGIENKIDNVDRSLPSLIDFEVEPEINKNNKLNVGTDELIEYGINKQLLGRMIPVILDDLTKKSLYHILTEIKDSKTGKSLLDSTKEQVQLFYPNITIKPEVLRNLVSEAYEEGNGARTLHKKTNILRYSIVDYLRKTNADSNEKIIINNELAQKAKNLYEGK